jgi:hypothetical protein
VELGQMAPTVNGSRTNAPRKCRRERKAPEGLSAGRVSNDLGWRFCGE